MRPATVAAAGVIPQEADMLCAEFDQMFRRHAARLPVIDSYHVQTAAPTALRQAPVQQNNGNARLLQSSHNLPVGLIGVHFKLERREEHA
jgi:hypothetical protein